MTHQSLRSQEGISNLFKRMFPDSQIAQDMKLSRTKAGYLVTHGLGPLFELEAKNKLKNVDHFVACFDESHNKVINKEQMDIAVKLWDTSRNEVITKYWKSLFLGHTRAVDLKGGFLNAFKDPVESRTSLLCKCVQISMDGPNVNWSLIKMLQYELQSDESDPACLECGSCGLHTVHNAFRVGVEATGWGTELFLVSLHGVFKKSPAKRDDSTNVTKSTEFPLKFCACRWVENAGKYGTEYHFFIFVH